MFSNQLNMFKKCSLAFCDVSWCIILVLIWFVQIGDVHTVSSPPLCSKFKAATRSWMRANSYPKNSWPGVPTRSWKEVVATHRSVYASWTHPLALVRTGGKPVRGPRCASISDFSAFSAGPRIASWTFQLSLFWSCSTLPDQSSPRVALGSWMAKHGKTGPLTILNHPERIQGHHVVGFRSTLDLAWNVSGRLVSGMVLAARRPSSQH